MKIEFVDHNELEAFIRLLQEIVIALEAELLSKTNYLDKYETQARIELLEDLYPKVAKKQFNNQRKNTVIITKAIALIIFQYKDIVIDIYAEMLKNRIVQNIHRDMV
ncbi:MAG: hypothetical protein AUJ98_11295 [Bacteroidetes bacterium CG2_30_33_31]|nr:MAG: hypothetical protein AUJ98_11295 [Bacteroidetes bacterium CG2_30_33_31]